MDGDDGEDDDVDDGDEVAALVLFVVAALTGWGERGESSVVLVAKEDNPSPWDSTS